MQLKFSYNFLGDFYRDITILSVTKIFVIKSRDANKLVNYPYIKPFKAYYSTTVYGDITRLRMEKAKKMIVNDHKSIGEVAIAIGFKHQAHLTSAFKKYYGILPSEIKLTL